VILGPESFSTWLAKSTSQEALLSLLRPYPDQGGPYGVLRTVTAPVVPPDRVGIGGWGSPQAPAVIGDACYVHIKAQAGAAAGLAERLGEMADVSGVAVLGGRADEMVAAARQVFA